MFRVKVDRCLFPSVAPRVGLLIAFARVTVSVPAGPGIDLSY